MGTCGLMDIVFSPKFPCSGTCILHKTHIPSHKRGTFRLFVLLECGFHVKTLQVTPLIISCYPNKVFLK